jgi:Phosphotransferase enzyme family
LTRTKYVVHLAVLHPSQPRLLALRDGDRLRLPCPHPLEGFQGGLEQTVLHDLGIRVRSMRSIHFALDLQDADRRSVLGVAELLNGDEIQPPGSVWIARDEIQTLETTHAAYPDLLRSLLANDGDGGRNPLRPGWTRRGWLQEVETWLGEQLGAFELELQRTWSISSVARIHAQQGQFYFKAVCPHFHAEPRISSYLTTHFSGHVPDVVAVEERRGWLLLREFGGEALLKRDLQSWERAIHRFAEMQIQAIPQVREMLDWGFADRKLDHLMPDLTRMLAQDELAIGLTDDEVEELRLLRPFLSSWCQELADLGPPATLVHGDLHPNNINEVDGRFIFFDWTDAAISHPFVDLVPFHLWEADGVPERAERLNRAYLDAWQDVVPAHKLLRALTLIKPIGPLYHAQSYFLLVLGLEEEVRWQFYDTYPRLLRRVITETRALRAQHAE